MIFLAVSLEPTAREQAMDVFMLIFGIALLGAALGFVLYNHWLEHHADNHF